MSPLAGFLQQLLARRVIQIQIVSAVPPA